MSERKKVSLEFYKCHPLVNLIYFLFVIGITMFSNHPLFLVITFIGAWYNSIFWKGKQAVKTNCLFVIPVFFIVTIVNVLNVHNGMTVFFYLNNNPITLEAMLYGMAQAVLIGSVILWCSCLNEILTSDKWIYLFGRVAPTIGLLISMILRFVPFLKQRYIEIYQGQKCLGRHSKKTGKIEKIRQMGKEISILTAWSLEASIETADSMEARGYGLKGRSLYHLFHFQKRDGILLLYFFILGSIICVAGITGRTDIDYYPQIRFLKQDIFFMVSAVCYGILIISPIILERKRGEKRNGFIRVEEL